ncbi:MAG: hypothetical protein LBU11_10985 [Zoogloeaceae bacterium]|jgi:hypothetical protein|nr:hypothetical protein [Zoogloeaceae bacterium]
MKKLLFAALCLFVFLLASGAGSARSCSDETLKSLATEDVQVRFIKDQGKTLMETIGLIRNTGKEKAEDIRLVTRHLDAEQRLIDVSTTFLYGITLAPGEDVAFHFGNYASLPESVYASHETRAVSADCAYTEPSALASGEPSNTTPSSQWGEWLMNWLPLLIIIVIWIYWIYRYYGSRSPTMRRAERQVELLRRQVELMEQRNPLDNALMKCQVEFMERQAERMEQQNALIERIAAALEERNKS